MMETNEKYEKITEIMRKSQPRLPFPEIFEEKVMEKIREKKSRAPYPILDCLFGWAFIGWVRNGLVTISFLLVLLFAFQQTIILRRINSIEKKALYAEPVAGTIKSSLLDMKSSLVNFSLKQPLETQKITEKDMRQIYESLNEIQSKYKELILLINENPELKRYINDKLSENEKKKFNL
jgi:hypothetical protein